MKRFSVASATLVCLLTVAACSSDDDPKTTVGSAPSASVAAPSAVGPAPSSAATPAPSAPAAGIPAEPASDKAVCQSAKKASSDMKAALVAALRSGDEASPALVKTILTELGQRVRSLAAAGNDSKVTAALEKFAAQAGKAAAAPDPAAAADNAAFERAGAKVNAVCKGVGVKVTF